MRNLIPLMALVLCCGILTPVQATDWTPPDDKYAGSLAEEVYHVAQLVESAPADLDPKAQAKLEAIAELLADDWAQELIAVWEQALGENPKLKLTLDKAHSAKGDTGARGGSVAVPRVGWEVLVAFDASGPGALAEALEAFCAVRSSSMAFLMMQQKMQEESRQFTTISNVLKTKHDTVKNSINNVR